MPFSLVKERHWAGLDAPGRARMRLAPMPSHLPAS